MSNFRKIVLDLLIPYFEKDEAYHLLVCDMGFAVMDKIKEAFPDRVHNMGIMEQGTVGIAAGMARGGLKPIVYSIVNFLVFRALEQIRNDIVLPGLPVKLIGTGAEDYFEHLGPSHCCGDDDIAIFDIIELVVFGPYSPTLPAEEVVRQWLTLTAPAYLRV